MDRVLTALDRPDVIEPAALRVGNRLIGLLDVREHLGVELRLELLGGSHDREGVSILRLQVGDHLGRGFVPHPAVVILKRMSM